MQGVGSQVFILILPIGVILGIAAYTYRQDIKNAYNYVFGNYEPPAGAGGDEPHRPRQFLDAQCSICLDQPKKFEVSGTCGHSFCSECVFSIYQRTFQKVQCPLCRQPITTMFKVFNNDELPAQTRVTIQGKIKEYNARFDDNRPFIRRIMQFPYVLRRLSRYMVTPQFWLLFLRSLHFFRVIGLAIFYLVLPVDLVPQRLFGIVGFLDDLFIFLIFLCLGMALFAPIFIRAWQH